MFFPPSRLFLPPHLRHHCLSAHKSSIISLIFNSYMSYSASVAMFTLSVAFFTLEGLVFLTVAALTSNDNQGIKRASKHLLLFRLNSNVLTYQCNQNNGHLCGSKRSYTCETHTRVPLVCGSGALQSEPARPFSLISQAGGKPSAPIKTDLLPPPLDGVTAPAKTDTGFQGSLKVNDAVRFQGWGTA